MYADESVGTIRSGGVGDPQVVKSKGHLSPGLQFELIWPPIDVCRSGYGEVAHPAEAQARRRFVPDEARKYGCNERRILDSRPAKEGAVQLYLDANHRVAA